MEAKNHECYVSLEIAKLLKEIGFDWECACAYMSKSSHGSELFRWYYQPTDYNHNQEDKNFEVYSAPTLDVAQRWLREVKGVEVYAHVFYDTYDTSEGWDVYVYEVNHIIKQIEDWINSYDVYHSYEEAQEAGIKKVLEILLKKGK